MKVWGESDAQSGVGLTEEQSAAMLSRTVPEGTGQDSTENQGHTERDGAGDTETAGSQGGERKTEKKRNKKNKKERRKNERENGGEQISQGEVGYIDIKTGELLALLFITLINFFNCISLWKLYIVKLF